MSKDLIYRKMILEILINNPVISVKEISRIINLSEKTTRNKIEKLDNDLQNSNIASINKKPGKGIYLEVEAEKNNALLILLNDDKKQSDIYLMDDRELLFRLLIQKEEEYITQSVLARDFFLSIPTLRKKLTSISEWLSQYQLQLVSIRKKGISIKGDEYSKRLAIKEFILTDLDDLEKELQKFTYGLDINHIKNIIREAERNWKIKFSKNSFNKIWIMVCLSLYRKENISEKTIKKVISIEYYSEFNFSDSIYQLLVQNGFKSYDDIDKKVLAIEILGASKLSGEMGTNDQDKSTRDYIDLDKFVTKIISSISDVLEEDLTKDRVLKEDLKGHLRSAIFRLRYGQNNALDLSKQLKQDYSRVFLSVWATSQLFETYYGIQITENELSYIVLYVEAAILRKKSIAEAVLVTEQGKSESLFVVELLKRNIPELENIEILRKSDISEKRLSNKIILSNNSILGNNSISISYIPNSKDFEKIRQVIDKRRKYSRESFYFSKSIQGFFDPRLIFPNIDFQDKEKLLKMMTKNLENMGSVTNNFFKTLWSRENKTTTCISYFTAIPHGSMLEVNEPKIAVATLKKPIIWFNDEKVDTVFLLATKMNTEININRTKQFYMDLIQFTENQTAFNGFKNISNGIEGYNYLFNY